MSTINFLSKKIEMPKFDEEKVRTWIEEVARRHDRRVGDLNYIFCNDEKILEVNIEFLQHDYYTDIITFDYSTKRKISGDIFISLDTVASNAGLFAKDYDEEFMRVVIHGVLHLCGINDKGEGEREIMEQHENDALALWTNDISKI
ncbi:MAG: rRNA maturation RNase YbeY [Bacteroidales bacterium]|nr:rRNA maturation RNase YbeY [Bacteroidales bacterium]